MKALIASRIRVVFGHGLSLATCITILVGCRQPSMPTHLSSEEVMRLLMVAYAKQDSGDLAGADSVYRSLLSYEVSFHDSIAISGAYVSVLIGLEKGSEAMLHIDRAFPAGLDQPRELMRRHSFRFQVFMMQQQCDSLWVEIERGYQLVMHDSTLQLKQEDMDINRAVLSKRCPR